MKAIIVDEFHSSLNGLKVSHVPTPQGQHDQILIRVVAAGINYVDILYVRSITSLL